MSFQYHRHSIIDFHRIFNMVQCGSCSLLFIFMLPKIVSRVHGSMCVGQNIKQETYRVVSLLGLVMEYRLFKTFLFRKVNIDMKMLSWRQKSIGPLIYRSIYSYGALFCFCLSVVRDYCACHSSARSTLRIIKSHRYLFFLYIYT